MKKIGIYVAKGVGKSIKTKKYPRGSDIQWRTDLSGDLSQIGKPFPNKIRRGMKKYFRKQKLAEQKKQKFYNWG